MDTSENSTRVRKPNSLLVDERPTVFVNGYAVPVAAPALPPVVQQRKKQKTVPAPVAAPAEAVVVPPEPAVELPQPDGTGPKEAVPANRVQIVWTDNIISLLLDKIVAKNATEHGKMDERFDEITKELFELDSFKNFTKVKGDSIRAYFTKLKKNCKAKWAMDSEGANLSGLAEFDSDARKPWEKKLYTLIVKEMKGEKGKAITTVKGIQREISMLTHERTVLLKGLKGVKTVVNVEEEGDEEGEEEEEGEGDESKEDGADKDKEGHKRKGKKKTQKELANELRRMDTPYTKKSSSRSATGSTVKTGLTEETTFPLAP